MVTLKKLFNKHTFISNRTKIVKTKNFHAHMTKNKNGAFIKFQISPHAF